MLINTNKVHAGLNHKITQLLASKVQRKTEGDSSKKFCPGVASRKIKILATAQGEEPVCKHHLLNDFVYMETSRMQTHRMGCGPVG